MGEISSKLLFKVIFFFFFTVYLFQYGIRTVCILFTNII